MKASKPRGSEKLYRARGTPYVCICPLHIPKQDSDSFPYSSKRQYLKKLLCIRAWPKGIVVHIPGIMVSSDAAVMCQWRVKVTKGLPLGSCICLLPLQVTTCHIACQNRQNRVGCARHQLTLGAKLTIALHPQSALATNTPQHPFVIEKYIVLKPIWHRFSRTMPANTGPQHLPFVIEKGLPLGTAALSSKRDHTPIWPPHRFSRPDNDCTANVALPHLDRSHRRLCSCGDGSGTLHYANNLVTDTTPAVINFVF
jgi:hypothetical protein